MKNFVKTIVNRAPVLKTSSRGPLDIWVGLVICADVLYWWLYRFRPNFVTLLQCTVWCWAKNGKEEEKSWLRLNPHLGKPIDVLLWGGRSKRSRDLDLDATFFLRWAWKLKENAGTQWNMFWHYTWPPIRLTAVSSIIKLILAVLEQEVWSVLPFCWAGQL